MPRRRKYKNKKEKKSIWKRHYYFRNLFKMSNIGNTLLSLFVVWLGIFVMLFLWIAQDVNHLADSIQMQGIEYNEAIRRDVNAMVAGYPIERMSVYIAQFDREVAAYLVSIAKKESNWGKRVPVKNGKDCFNYWGYRDPDNTEGSGGHTCFRSSQSAVLAVGRRMEQLVREHRRETPREMVVWKCGSACGEDPNALKWVEDVGYYYDLFMEQQRDDVARL